MEEPSLGWRSPSLGWRVVVGKAEAADHVRSGETRVISGGVM